MDHADYVAPDRHPELDPTDQENVCPARQLYIINCSAVVGRDHTDHADYTDHTDHLFEV